MFAPQLNTFVKLLGERQGEKFSVTNGKMANYTRTRVQMSILRAESTFVRASRRRFKSGKNLLVLIIDRKIVFTKYV